MDVPIDGSHVPAEELGTPPFSEPRSNHADTLRSVHVLERVVSRELDLFLWLFITVGWVLLVVLLIACVSPWLPDYDAETYQPTAFEVVVVYFVSGSIVVGWLVSMYAIEVFPTARTGRHWSKVQMGFRVVGPDGAPPSLKRASVRWAALFIPLATACVMFFCSLMTAWWPFFLALLCVSLVIPGWMFWDRESRGLHDRLAGTRVISDR